MRHRWTIEEDHQRIEYNWRVGTQWQTFAVTADVESQIIMANSDVEFITEHYWGYSKNTVTKTTEYEVTHPRWEQSAVSDYTINVDFALNYGPRFAFLNERTPTSVFLAEGSAITIEGKRKLEVLGEL